MAAGAAVAVLQKFAGGDKISAGYVYPPLGVQRQWTSLAQIAKEVEDARVWGGIHFRTATEHGTQIGRKISEHGLNTYMQLVNK